MSRRQQVKKLEDSLNLLNNVKTERESSHIENPVARTRFGQRTLPVFPSYSQFNPANNRDDDDTHELGFEVTRKKVKLSKQSLAHIPTPRSPPHRSTLRKITAAEFSTAIKGKETGSTKAKGILPGGMEADVVFSAVVGLSLDGKKQIITTMIKTVGGPIIVTYRDHPGNSEIQAGDFVWSPRAMAFKEGFSKVGGYVKKGDGDGRLGEETALTFMNMLYMENRL